MNEIIGWLGAICLGVCGIPQAYHSFTYKNSDGITNGFLYLWFFGEVFQLIYVINNSDIPLIFNCIFNIVLCLVIVWYKFFPKNV